MPTPVMQQYLSVRAQHQDGLLLFRMGDFFELFLEDAEKASRLLGLTLTSRDKGENPIPMAGIPARTLDTYVNRLVRMGEKVIICDQVQDAKDADGIIDRAVVRVVTAGTLTEDAALPDRDNNFLCGVVIGSKTAGVSWVDLSTGAFFATEVAPDGVIDLLARVDPAELLLPDSSRDAHGPYRELRAQLPRPTSTFPDWMFDADEGVRVLREHFRVRTLDGFGIGELRGGAGAAGAVLKYLQDTQKGRVEHIIAIRQPDFGRQVVLDRVTRASLELVRTLRDGTREGSVLSVIDRTKTSAGARLLKGWVVEPLAQVADIRRRQDGVAELVGDLPRLRALRDVLEKVHDIERLLARLSCGRASARELVSLRQSLELVPGLRDLLAASTSEILRVAASGLPDLTAVTDMLRRGLVDEPPPTVKEGGMIRTGYSAEVDELHSLKRDGQSWIARYQAEQIEKTGIPTLKVAYNRVFGWYLEITNVHSAKVPPEYSRRQTVKNAERYVTPELKEFEHKVLHAEERIGELEYELFLELRAAVLARLPEVQQTSDTLALLDALQSLAQVAREWNGCRPELHDGIGIDIKEGRHPVLAAQVGGPAFVPNDLLFGDDRRLIVITGPNMAGKSTYIRQSALLVLLAQIGSFLPAASASIGVVDRIFTRVGASDELARGNSTFMVEMIETANILHHASERSLVILDEVGRGTSTFDGLALAWAITEHLARKVRCRALFATHYHQLVDLGATEPGAVNASVAVREWGDEIVFLHKIIEGGTDRSYGLHVARLAGLPREVIERAKDVLAAIEAQPVTRPPADERAAKKSPEIQQLSLFDAPEDPILTALREADLDRLAPFDALCLLREWKKKLR